MGNPLVQRFAHVSPTRGQDFAEEQLQQLRSELDALGSAQLLAAAAEDRAALLEEESRGALRRCRSKKKGGDGGYSGDTLDVFICFRKIMTNPMIGIIRHFIVMNF